MKAVLAIVPVGDVNRTVCRELGQAVAEELGLELDVRPALAEPAYAYNPGREQYHSTAILKRVAMAMNGDKHRLGLGVVQVDLFMPDLNFVFGEADRNARAAITSLARLDPRHYGQPADHATLLRRAVAETLHELGHILGLPHCQNESCGMFYANTLSDTDRKRARFCDVCRDRLVKGQLV